jgi:hypothetical protein
MAEFVKKDIFDKCDTGEAAIKEAAFSIPITLSHPGEGIFGGVTQITLSVTAPSRRAR